MVCNRQKQHALLLNLWNSLGFFWVAGCSTFFLPGSQGCRRGERESVSQSVQLQHTETIAVFHEGHEWGMKKKPLICVTRVTERKREWDYSKACLWKCSAQERGEPLYIVSTGWRESISHIPLLMYVMQMSFLTQFLLFVPVGPWQAFLGKSSSSSLSWYHPGCLCHPCHWG